MQKVTPKQGLYLVLSILALNLLSPSWALSKQSTAHIVRATASEKSEGGVAGGGGFEFYNSFAVTHVRSAISNILQVYKQMPNETFKRILKHVSNYTQNEKVLRIDQQLFVSVIENIIFDYTSELKRKNPDGKTELLVMNYELNNNTVTALRPLFQSYNRQVLTAAEKTKLASTIIHEALHIFNIGVREDNEAAYITQALLTTTWSMLNSTSL